MIKRYIKGQIKKHGVKAFVIKVLELIAKATPSKDCLLYTSDAADE